MAFVSRSDYWQRLALTFQFHPDSHPSPLPSLFARGVSLLLPHFSSTCFSVELLLSRGQLDLYLILWTTIRVAFFLIRFGGGVFAILTLARPSARLWPGHGH